MIKEAEIDALAMPWANARVANLLLACRMTTMEVANGTEDKSSSSDYNQVMFNQNVETVDAFFSHVVLVKVERAYTGECINIMVQALWTKDGSLSQSLTLQNMYTELR